MPLQQIVPVELGFLLTDEKNDNHTQPGLDISTKEVSIHVMESTSIPLLTEVFKVVRNAVACFKAVYIIGTHYLIVYYHTTYLYIDRSDYGSLNRHHFLPFCVCNEPNGNSYAFVSQIRYIVIRHSCLEVLTQEVIDMFIRL